MLVLLGVVGLAIDAGLAYLVKARLNAAVDSAALAGARAVPTGNNQAEQIASAKAAAQDFFDANIPGNYLLSSPKIVSTNVAFNGGQAIIDVKAEAPMPVSIMQVMNFSSLTPVAAAQTIRNDLDMAFVVDTSASLASQGAAVKASAKTFLNKFNVTQDRVSLIHFASGAETDFPISTSSRGFNRTGMLKKIDTYQFLGGTASVEGMWNAREELEAIPLASRSVLRVIVFFSDGGPTAFGSYVTFQTPSDCTDAGTIDRVANGGMSNMNSSPTSIISPLCAIKRNNSTMSRRLPDWYNGHNLKINPNDPAKREFRVVTTTPRIVTADVSSDELIYRNVERAARNLAESISSSLRDDNVVIFTLGMGSDLKATTSNDPTGSTGEMILKCMANVTDAPARCFNPAQPIGMYCYAATEADLTPCFSRLASAILRITK